MSREELLAEAMKLPEWEREWLSGMLVTTLPIDPEWEAACVEEVMRRSDRYHAGETVTTEWREAMRRVRESLGMKP